MNNTTVANVPFDLERARALIVDAGYEFEVELPQEDDLGTFQARVSKPNQEPLVMVEWAISGEEWRVYVDDGDGTMDVSVARMFVRDINRATTLADKLNVPLDADAPIDGNATYVIPCTEIHCEKFGIGHEEFLSFAHDESVIHTRPTDPATNWGVVVTKTGDQAEWTVDLNASPYEMPVSEIDELVAQLLLARADLVSINAAVTPASS